MSKIMSTSGVDFAKAFEKRTNLISSNCFLSLSTHSSRKQSPKCIMRPLGLAGDNPKQKPASDPAGTADMNALSSELLAKITQSESDKCRQVSGE
jgi:hypothetical protein